MALTSTDLQLGAVNGGRIFTSGALHDMFARGVIGAATDYCLVEVRNTSNTTTWFNPKAFLGIDPGGASIGIAVADNTPRALSYATYAVNPAALTYTTPSTAASGVALASIGPGMKVLIALRRVLTGAVVADPETNILAIDGT